MIQDEIFQKALLKENIITKKQLENCIYLQRESHEQRPIIYYLIDKGYINDDNLQRAISLQKNYFENLFNPTQTSSSQDKTIFHCNSCNKNFNIRNYKVGKVYFCPRCKDALEEGSKEQQAPKTSSREMDYNAFMDPLEESQEVSRVMDSIETMLFNEPTEEKWWKDMDAKDKDIWIQLATDEEKMPIQPKKRRKSAVKKPKKPATIKKTAYKMPRDMAPTELSPYYSYGKNKKEEESFSSKNFILFSILILAVSILSFLIGTGFSSESEEDQVQTLRTILEHAKFTGSYSNAIKKLEKIKNRNWLWWRTCGEIRYLMGQYKKAKDCFLYSLNIHENGISYLGLGKCMEELGEPKESCLQVYEKALLLQPSNVEISKRYEKLKSRK